MRCLAVCQDELVIRMLDEILLQVGSVTLGRGKPLFPRRLTQPPLKLLGVRQVGSGFAELRYAVPHG